MIDTTAIRKRILSLAVHGQLSKQNDVDTKVNALYSYLADGIEKNKSVLSVELKDEPFGIPNGWKWIRLGEITTVISKGTTPRGGNVAYLNEGIGFLRAENLMGYDKINTQNLKYVDEETHLGFLKRSILVSGDILISIAGTLGRTGLVRDEDLPLNTNQAIAFIRISKKEAVNLRYFTYILNSDEIQKELGNKKVEMAIPNLSLDVISQCMIPLPPAEEQNRIVERISNIFELLDIIDNLQSQYSSDLEVLKSKLIDAGIRGKLTEQLPEDGNAEDLYATIQAEKKKLIEEKKIPKEKELPVIHPEEYPFPIPSNWKWVRVQDVASYITDYVANGSFATLKAHTKTYKEPNYAIFVRTMDLSANFQDQCSYIDKESYDFLEKSKLFGGELILPNIGASIGKAFVMPDLGMPMSLAPNSILLKFTDPVMNEYFSFVVKSTYGGNLLNKTQGGSATAKFSKTDLRTLIVPLPPLNEIRRIVNKINDIETLMM